MKPEDLVEGVKRYGKIEFEPDEEIIPLIGAAIDTLEGAGVSRESTSDLYVLAIKRLAMHYYENREEITTVTGQMPMGMNWMITHLRLKKGV